MEQKGILDKIAHRDGMTVPDGYFASFEARMKASLPPQPWEQQADSDAAARPAAPRPRLWQRVRPYVYMAAMFAGIWLMMHMASLTTPPTAERQLADNPVLAAALTDDRFVDDLGLDDIDPDDVADLIYEQGLTIEGLRQAAASAPQL